jgi:RNA polymerase sigma-70 factor (ECF subfamily)
MRRAVKPRPEAAVSGAGLRALARLIAVELGIPALAGVGPLVMHVEVADSATTHSAGRRPRPRPASAGPSPVPAAEPPAGNGAVSAEHQETWRLVQLAQQGDGEAFGQLYDRYVDTVFRFIYFRVNDRALAEDFTSETFLRALRRIDTISYQGRDIGAWFITIARNIVLDHVKSARNRLEVTTADTIEGREQAQSTENAVLRTLDSERLMSAIAQLGDEQRECVMLRFLNGMSVSETAAIMAKNEGAIKALQHRAVRKLAELLGSEAR